jgi:hypothetical protein
MNLSLIFVEYCDSGISNDGDESGSATSWTEVASKKKKKKTDALKSFNLGGKQSDEKLTLFTKRS